MVELGRRLDGLARWTNLRAIGNSNAVKATILIPLLGYLLIFNEYALQYFELSRQLLGANANPEKTDFQSNVPIRLLVIYMGLCLIAAASLIFFACCPREIKKYGSATEFIAGDGESNGIAYLKKFAEVVAREENLQNDAKEFVVYVQNLRRKRDEKQLPTKIKDWREDMTEIENDGLYFYFDIIDRSRKAFRIVCCILFVGGFVLLAIPSAQVFYRVVQLFIRTFSQIYF